MKLFYDLSKLKESTTFKHDAQLITGVQIGIIVFLLLSSITVFSGIKTHLSDYLFTASFLWRSMVYVSSYLVGSLGIDVVNTVCLAFVVSAILRKDFERESIILIVFCSLLSIGLTSYSFLMSQNSALVIGDDIKTEKQKDDTNELTRIDTTLNNKIALIESNYQANYDRSIVPFKIRIDNISSTYNNQIEILKNEIAVIDANSTKENYLYAAKQKKPITAKIQDLEAAKLVSLSPVLSEQQKTIEDLTAQKSTLIKDAQEAYRTDRSRTKSKTDNYNDQVKASSTVFSNLFSKLSGYAVFALLLLTSIREVLYFRNDIEPEPILSNFDFAPSWIMEVLSYPFIWIRRHSVNKVRTWYAELPNLERPVIEDEIIDGRSLGQEIVEPDDPIDPEPLPDYENIPGSPGGIAPNMPTGRPRHLRGKDYFFASVPATEGGVYEMAENSISQYSHETPDFGGLQNELEPLEPTKSSTHEIAHETEKKIKHIGKNDKTYWYNEKQVAGKVKKYVTTVRTWTKKADRKKATNRDKQALANNQGLLNYWKGRLIEFE